MLAKLSLCLSTNKKYGTLKVVRGYTVLLLEASPQVSSIQLVPRYVLLATSELTQMALPHAAWKLRKGLNLLTSDVAISSSIPFVFPSQFWSFTNSLCSAEIRKRAMHCMSHVQELRKRWRSWSSPCVQEGFQPATFRSSRDTRGNQRAQQIADFLDEDELEELQTKGLHARAEYDTFASAHEAAFAAQAALQATTRHGGQALNLFPQEALRPVVQSIGIQLLQKMGWKQVRLTLHILENACSLSEILPFVYLSDICRV
jgi:hypothetical protein